MTTASSQTFSDPALPDLPEVSERSKKGEILEAYEVLLKEFQRKGADKGLKKEQKKAEEEQTLQRTSGNSPEKVLESVAAVDSLVRRSLHDLAEAFLRELQKFRELEESIRIAKAELERLHAIKVQADSLENLLDAQKLQKQAFEENMTKEASEFERAMQMKKDAWKREQEQYEYERNKQRKQEEDEYERKRMTMEEALAARERQIAESEKELTLLRQKAAEFDVSLARDVSKAREEASIATKKEDQVIFDMAREKYEAERQISVFTIQSLKDKSVTMEREIEELKQKLTQANEGVKDIAVKVIEGRSRAVEAERLGSLLREQKSQERK